MTKTSALEPVPRRFFAPKGLYSPNDLAQLKAEYLGDCIFSPGGSSFQYFVASGLLCRLYWANNLPQPHSFESAYYPDEQGKWRREHGNYLSYLLSNGSYLTVRWVKPSLKNSSYNANKTA